MQNSNYQASKSDYNKVLNISKRDDIKEKTYTSRQIETSIALLDTIENDIILDALIFLSKFADIQQNNLRFLQRSNVVPKLLNLFNKNICILRLAIRLLSNLLTIPESIIDIDNESYDESIKEIVKFFVSHSDPFVKEFSLKCLARIATSTRVTVLVFDVDILNPLFDALHSEENEIILPALQLLYTVLSAPAILSSLPQQKKFDPQIIYKNMTNENYDISNLVLEIFRKICFSQLEVFHKTFRLFRLMEKMLVIVMDPNQYLHHKKAFSILIESLKQPANCGAIVEYPEFLKFCNWAKEYKSEFSLYITVILRSVSKLPQLRQILFDLSVDDTIMSFLKSKDKKVLNETCLAISDMCTHRYCCEKMLESSIIPDLLNILQRSDANEDKYNTIALKTLHDFTIKHMNSLDVIHNNKGCPILLSYLKRIEPKGIHKTLLRTLEIFNALILRVEYVKSVVCNEFFEIVLKQLENPEEDIVQVALEIMTNSVTVEDFRFFFLSYKGPELAINCFAKCKNMNMMKFFLIFIHSCLMYKQISHEFLLSGLLKHLQNLPPQIKESAPFISSVINLLYELYLPVKFFELHRLDIVDRLKDKFYIMTGQWNYPFPFLEILERQKISTINTIYVVDYSFEFKKTDYEDLNLNSSVGSLSVDNSRKSLEQEERMYLHYGRVSKDPYLPKFIYHLQKYFINNTCLTHKIQLLAAYVDSLLCGPEESSMPQKVHAFKLHISALKYKLGTNVIPIGFLRLGFHCERALMFKAIANQINIPCSLVKGSNNIYWNEVGILREDGLDVYVVDLLFDIGKLMLNGSREANRYCKFKITEYSFLMDHNITKLEDDCNLEDFIL